jgi:general secretion pathway protein G
VNVKNRAQTGFTLIEILVVVVIIGIIAGLIVPNVIGRDEQAKVAAARNDIRAIANALEMYRLDNNHYPSTEQGLEALASRPSGFPEPRNYNEQGYLRRVPVDPWDNEFIYINNGRSFELYSLGADGSEGGEGFNAEIHYRDL